MKHSFIVAGCRTPVGKFQGGLASLAAPQLALWSWPKRSAARTLHPIRLTK